MKPFSGRNNSPELPVFGLANSLLYVLEESRQLEALVSWVSFRSIGFEKCKKKFPFLVSFDPPLWIY